MTCKHSAITVCEDHRGVCLHCRSVVPLESVPAGPGGRFFWLRSAVEKRSQAHPANDPRYYEATPGRWEFVG